MAKQKQVVKLDKTLNSEGLTFYKRGDIHYVRLKSTLSGKKVKKSKQFERTRENAKEFAITSSFSALIRLVFREFVVGISGRHQDRLLKLIYEFRIDDLLAARGFRNIQNGLAINDNQSKLIGFNFDENNLLNGLLNKVNATDYVAKVTNFIPSQDLVLDFYATHFEFVSIVGHVLLPVSDFSRQNETFIKSVVSSGKISVSLSTSISVNLTHDVLIFKDNLGNFIYSDNEKRLELFGFGILFYLAVGGGFIPVSQNKTIGQITNVLLNNDLVVIDVNSGNSYVVLHNLGHIPFVWLLDNDKFLSESLILHSSGNEFTVTTSYNQPYKILYYMRVGVSISFLNVNEVLVTHNLGRYVPVQVIDPVGVICSCGIEFISINSFMVRFGDIFSGTIIYYP